MAGGRRSSPRAVAWEEYEEFYLRYYVGHRGRYGHEYLKFELRADGRLSYANQSNYRGGAAAVRRTLPCIRKQVLVSSATIRELRRIIQRSDIMNEDDCDWPKPDVNGRQELEIRIGDKHVSFLTSEIDSLVDLQQTKDPEGLCLLHFFVQDLKCLVFSLISLHFKIKPIPS